MITSAAISVRVTFFRAIAESWSRKKREAALLGEFRPCGRPDLDNLVKAITDGLNGVIYVDDSLIVETHSAKFYGIEPRTEISLQWQPNGDALIKRMQPSKRSSQPAARDIALADERPPS